MSGCMQTCEFVNVFQPSRELSYYHGYDKWSFLKDKSGILSETKIVTVRTDNILY